MTTTVFNREEFWQNIFSGFFTNPFLKKLVEVALKTSV
jgi:hypothetical protein